MAALYASVAVNFKDFVLLNAVPQDVDSNQLGILTSAASDAGMDLLDFMVDFVLAFLIIQLLEWSKLGTELRLSKQGYFILWLVLLCADFSARRCNFPRTMGNFG